VEIRLSASASRALRRSDKRRLITKKIDELARDPLALRANVKRLAGRGDYRLRIQNWRVIFRLEGNVLWIDEVVTRGSAYED
jgi:mRNA interferase RelE/StbE